MYLSLLKLVKCIEKGMLGTCKCKNGSSAVVWEFFSVLLKTAYLHSYPRASVSNFAF